ncbi:MAG: hypothetical protein K940chlam9_00825 [Chlamydiae bacterium]|nr:hypothetical protein [Chlamydiota bacterium]
MVPSTILITLYALIPMFMAILGSVIASFYIPKGKVVSSLQHFVAGIVIGAVAIELIPKILGHDSPWTIGFGFVIGVVVMLLVHELAHFLAKRGGERGMPYGLLIGGGIDLLLDGILIGISFLAGKESGIVIALSLSLCAFFVSATASTTLGKRQFSKATQILTGVFLGVLLPLGAFLGSAILTQFPNSILIETLAFGVAALLFLGIEELLAESHEEHHDTLWVSAAFFLGFLVILLFRL